MMLNKVIDKIKEILGIQALIRQVNHNTGKLDMLDDYDFNDFINRYDLDPDDCVLQSEFEDSMDNIHDRLEQLEEQNKKLLEMVRLLAVHINNQDVLDMLDGKNNDD